jgi:recombination protein RecT|tara:strand:- start:11407 stop:12516 length:1110 start_codon:yes stop_codon:yes gene_type:complete
MTEPQKQLKTYLEDVRPKFKEMMPARMDVTAEYGFAMQLLGNNQYVKKVAEENPISLASAVLNVAAVGLSLNPAKAQAYLIPRNVKVGDKWISKICFEPSYRGFCDLATMSGEIKWLQVNVVYENDSFIDNGPGDRPTHEYDAFAPIGDRGEIRGVYSVAKTKDGDYLTTLMREDELIAIRDKSESWKKSQNGPWKDFPVEQRKKTVVRRQWKMLPKVGDMSRFETAVHLSNENEGINFIESSPEITKFTADQKDYYDDLVSSNDDLGMFAFSQTIEEGAWISLYHSFPKGEKGKYRDVVNSLVASGRESMVLLRSLLEDATEAEDDLAIKEVVEETRQDVLSYAYRELDDQVKAFVELVSQESGEDNE